MNIVSSNFKPEARTRLMSIYGAARGAHMFARLDQFCSIVRKTGEALLVPPDVDEALHEVLSVRPCLELMPMDHFAVQGDMQHEEVKSAEHQQDQVSTGRTLGELVDLDLYREYAVRTLRTLKDHNFVSEDGTCYDQPACTLYYTQPACILRRAIS